MKNIKNQACAIVIMFATLTFLTSANANGLTSSLKTAKAIDTSEENQLTWDVPSKSDVKVTVASMGLSNVIPVKPGLSLVFANEGYTATDFGPVNRLFLVYHSKSEMPHYEATFFLGNIHSVKSVQSISESSIQIDTLLHARLQKLSEVRLLVDLSNLIKVMQTPPDKEGHLDVSVTVKAAKVP